MVRGRRIKLPPMDVTIQQKDKLRKRKSKQKKIEQILEETPIQI